MVSGGIPMDATRAQPDVAHPAEPACPAGCPHCSEAAEAIAAPTELAGWRLTVSAAGLFLVPLLLAIAGAGAAPAVWAHSVAQFVGGVGGLLIGIAGAVFVGRFLGRGAQEEA